MSIAPATYVLFIALLIAFGVAFYNGHKTIEEERYDFVKPDHQFVRRIIIMVYALLALLFPFSYLQAVQTLPAQACAVAIGIIMAAMVIRSRRVSRGQEPKPRDYK